MVKKSLTDLVAAASSASYCGSGSDWLSCAQSEVAKHSPKMTEPQRRSARGIARTHPSTGLD